jgi:hypothetical protein
MANGEPGFDMNFDLVEVGISGSVQVCPKIDRSKERIQLPLKTVRKL